MRSLRTRLALSLFLIVLVTVGIVAFGVLRSLSDGLRQEALKSLLMSAQRYSRGIDTAIDHSDSQGRIDMLVRDAADSATARVTLLGLYAVPGELRSYPKSDSTRQVEIRDLQFDVAIEAAQTSKPTTAIEAGDAGRVGEAAIPLIYEDPRTHKRVVGTVIVYSRPLSAIDAEVRVVRNRVLAATLIALLAAAIAAWLVARNVALRVQRLEVVAGRVSDGDLSARFPVESSDELGQLAQTLEQMRRQLAELDDARKRFIATASHELRTPLFSLGGFLELLEEEDLDEEDRRRFVTQLRQQVLRMQKLATDLLDLSKLEAGSLELRSERTDLGDVARMIADEFAPALVAHDAHMELRLAPKPVEVTCDPERVAQVLRILIDNAIIHTPPGTDLVVSASAPRQTAPGWRWGTSTGYPPDDAAADLRAVRHLRRRAGVRARARDRQRAGRADGRPAGRRLPAGAHDLHAGAARMRRTGLAALAAVATLVRDRLRRASGGAETEHDHHRPAHHARRGRQGRRCDGRLRPADDLPARLARCRDDPVGLRPCRQRERGRRAGLGLRDLRERRDRHQRPRRHRAARAARSARPASSSCGSATATRSTRPSSASTRSPTSRWSRSTPRGSTLRPLALGSSADVKVGEPVAAIGSPFGEEQSLSIGVVSATDREIESLTGFLITGALQTDAAINSGNSGGPLLDAGGRVLGINSQIRSASGSGSGVGFAVSIDAVRRPWSSCAATGRSATPTSASRPRASTCSWPRASRSGRRAAPWSNRS